MRGNAGRLSASSSLPAELLEVSDANTYEPPDAVGRDAAAGDCPSCRGSRRDAHERLGDQTARDQTWRGAAKPASWPPAVGWAVCVAEDELAGAGDRLADPAARRRFVRVPSRQCEQNRQRLFVYTRPPSNTCPSTSPPQSRQHPARCRAVQSIRSESSGICRSLLTKLADWEERSQSDGDDWVLPEVAVLDGAELDAHPPFRWHLSLRPYSARARGCKNGGPREAGP
jgi:hypothetical protein